MRRCALHRWVALLVIGIGVAPLHGVATTTPENRLKAAFVYKFATYVSWPASATYDPATAFVIGVLGEESLTLPLSEVVHDLTLRGKPIRVRTLKNADEAAACNVVFVSSSEQGHLVQILSSLRGVPVLTVSDIEGFAQRGGMIGLFITEDNHMRFDINKTALERVGLRASSQLLHLARIVDESREEGPR